jgi:hypothetical protein
VDADDIGSPRGYRTNLLTPCPLPEAPRQHRRIRGNAGACSVECRRQADQLASIRAASPDRVEQHEGARDAGGGRLAVQPTEQVVGRVGTDRAQGLGSEPDGVEHLRRPQADEGVRLRPEGPDAEARRERRSQPLSLRVVGAGGLLDVRQSRAILEMEQGGSVEIPGDDVCPPGELVVLVRLVERDAERPWSKER